jgi:hypothetical protein
MLPIHQTKADSTFEEYSARVEELTKELEQARQKSDEEIERFVMC